MNRENVVSIVEGRNQVHECSVTCGRCFMGIIYGLIAIGMVLIFRSVGVMNFAQGEFLMFGGIFVIHLIKY